MARYSGVSGASCASPPRLAGSQASPRRGFRHWLSKSGYFARRQLWEGPQPRPPAQPQGLSRRVHATLVVPFAGPQQMVARWFRRVSPRSAHGRRPDGGIKELIYRGVTGGVWLQLLGEGTEHPMRLPRGGELSQLVLPIPRRNGQDRTNADATGRAQNQEQTLAR